MAQKLKFGNGTWATKKGSTLAYNDENNNYKPLPFTTTRNSIATRVNKEGLIEVVGNDVPRIDYTDSADGVLLLEPQRTNLIEYSEDFSQSSWVKLGVGTGSAAVVTSNYAISPDGSQNASRLQCNLGNGNTVSDQSLIYDSYNLSGSQTISIYAKSNNNQNQTLYFSNTVTYDETDNIVVTNEWKRFEFTHSTSTDVLAIGLRGGTGSDNVVDVLVWGAQAEANSVASSYIPTSGSSVTRQADTASGSGNSEVFNDSQGVLFANIAALANDGVNKFISISDGTIANRINIVFDTSNNINARQAPGSVNISTSGVNILNSNKIAYEYQNGSQELWVNGFKIGETSVSTLPSGLDRLSFDSFNGGDDMYAKTKEIAYYDEILTDEELETLTSYRSLNELVTELNLNTL